jgi:hypothetical protein
MLLWFSADLRNYTGPLFTSGFSFNVHTKIVNAFEQETIVRLFILDFKDWALKGAIVKDMKILGILINIQEKNINAGDLNNESNNYRSIRYADVLLMAAEAFNRSGLSDVKARGYLNKLEDVLWRS